jgi:hypothetical protein
MNRSLLSWIGILLYVSFLVYGVVHIHGWEMALWKKGLWDVMFAAVLFIVFKVVAKLPTIMELMGYLLDEGLWYLIPEIFVLLAIGALLAVAAAYPIVSPFIYTLF